uniref:HMA domain-containing protein n=1 Tax=Brassica oleracea TaxID=3712 RepID=A0A3P6FNE8_BRAOL|nr:unnamed protein product [Brassica oleracea]
MRLGRENNGNCGLGWTFQTKLGTPLYKGTSSRRCVVSAIAAEAQAIKSALLAAANAGYRDLEVFSDCKSLVTLINSNVSSVALKSLLYDISVLSRNFSSISFTFTPRVNNVVADGLAKSALFVSIYAITFVALVGALLGVSKAQPSGSCVSTLTTLSPCLGYITGNSTTPSQTCCSQLDSVIKSSPQCICSAVNSPIPNIGLNINRTQALQLPNACNIQAPPLSQCNVATGPTTPLGVLSPVESPAEKNPGVALTPTSSPGARSGVVVGARGGSKTIPSTGAGSSSGSVDRVAPHLFIFICELFILFYYFKEEKYLSDLVLRKRRWSHWSSLFLKTQPWRFPYVDRFSVSNNPTSVLQPCLICWTALISTGGSAVPETKKIKPWPWPGLWTHTFLHSASKVLEIHFQYGNLQIRTSSLDGLCYLLSCDYQDTSAISINYGNPRYHLLYISLAVFSVGVLKSCVLRVGIKCCKGCQTNAKRKLLSVSGVSAVEYNAEQGLLRVSGDPNPAKLLRKLSKWDKNAELVSLPGEVSAPAPRTPQLNQTKRMGKRTTKCFLLRCFGTKEKVEPYGIAGDENGSATPFINTVAPPMVYPPPQPTPGFATPIPYPPPCFGANQPPYTYTPGGMYQSPPPTFQLRKTQFPQMVNYPHH